MREKLEEIFFNPKETKEEETYTYALLDASGSDDVYNKAIFYDIRFTALFDEEEIV